MTTNDDKRLEEIIDAACYGAIISLEGETASKGELKRYAYEVELMEEQRDCMSRELRFYGKAKLQKAVSDYIDNYYDEYADEGDDFEFTVTQ